jgi:hypothetical protein
MYGRVRQVSTHKPFHISVQSGREEHPLSYCWRSIQYSRDRRKEAKVGHMVSLVEHCYFHRINPAGTTFKQVNEPAWRGDDYIRSSP